MQKNVHFYGEAVDSPWIDATATKRYGLTFPFYPFRTLTPRELYRSRVSANSGGETNSPLIPAHVQLNFCFKRRAGPSFLNQMLIEQLPVRAGSLRQDLTADERRLALTYGGDAADAANPPYTITDVRVKLKNVWLQVRERETLAPLFMLYFFLPGCAGGASAVQGISSGTSADPCF